ncbi:MAG: alpha/beta fold hydrolase [Pseudohongiellaceae bacterium]
MELNYRQHSDEGPPLLILHGLFGSLSNWNWHARKWAEPFSVYALDLRNHGNSPHADSMTYPEMAGDVLDFLDHHGIDTCHLVGHSMGGKVAMQLAMDHPGRIRTLVVADIAPVPYEGEHDRIFAGLTAIDPAAVKTRQEADDVLVDYEEDEQVRLFLLSNLQRADGGGFEWRINLPALEACYEDLRAGLEEGRYEGPVLFLRGNDSNYIRESHREAILSRFPRAELKTLMQAGHWLHAEKPESFNRLVTEFISEHEDDDG